MGAATFIQAASGKTAAEARINATNDAAWEHGHRGYTGTMAEKDSHVMIPLPAGADPYAYAQQLIDEDDPRISDKWGPAGCIHLGGENYLFFGWASC